MNPLEVIHHQNAMVQLKHLQEVWIGQSAEAFSVADPDILQQGTIADVQYNKHNDRFEYLLTGQVGIFHNPTAVPCAEAMA